MQVSPALVLSSVLQWSWLVVYIQQNYPLQYRTLRNSFWNILLIALASNHITHFWAMFLYPLKIWNKWDKMRTLPGNVTLPRNGIMTNFPNLVYISCFPRIICGVACQVLFSDPSYVSPCPRFLKWIYCLKQEPVKTFLLKPDWYIVGYFCRCVRLFFQM